MALLKKTDAFLVPRGGPTFRTPNRTMKPPILEHVVAAEPFGNPEPGLVIVSITIIIFRIIFIIIISASS